MSNEIKNHLEPGGFTGFGFGYYTPVAAWPEDTLPLLTGTQKSPRNNAVIALNYLGYLGPGAWADAEGGLIICGCIDAPL